MAFSTSSYSAVEMAATQNLTANFCLASSSIGGKPLQQQVGVVIGALDQSKNGLEEISKTRDALAKQLDGNVLNVPSAAADAGGSLGIGKLATSAMAGVALTAINPALGAVYMAADAVKTGLDFATQSLSGAGGHAGLDHAAISGGTSTLSRSLSKGKESGTYIDVMGDSWGSDGFKLSELKTVKQSPSRAPSADPMFAQRGAKASQTIDRLGEDEVRTQLSQTSKIEDRLLQQADTAKRYAKDVFGVVGPDAKADYVDPKIENKPPPSFRAPMGGPSFG